MKQRDDEAVWEEVERRFALEGHVGRSVRPEFVKIDGSGRRPPIPLIMSERHERYDAVELEMMRAGLLRSQRKVTAQSD